MDENRTRPASGGQPVISRRRLIGASAGLAALALANGAAPRPAGASGVELTYAMFAGATELAGWTAQVDAANKLLAPKNISIKIQKITATGWSEYYQKVVAQVAAGRSPDIGRPAESLMPQIVHQGLATEQTSYIKQLDMTQYFAVPFQSAGDQDGKYYGFPSGSYNMVLYYNKSLFDQAGLPHPSADWNHAITFDQVRDAAKKLTKGSGGSKQFGFYGGPNMAFIGMYAVSNGGKNVFNANGSCALTEPASLEVYRWFDAMLREDKSMPRPTETKVISPLDMFRSGRLAMSVDGTWDHSPIRQITKFPVGIAAVPSGKGTASSSEFVDKWVIWQGTKHSDEAWEAIKALNSKEGLTALAKAGVGGTPVLKSVFEEMSDTLIGGKFDANDKGAFRGALEHALPVPYTEFYQEADDRANSAMDEWLLGRITADEYAAKVCDILSDLAKKS